MLAPNAAERDVLNVAPRISVLASGALVLIGSTLLLRATLSVAPPTESVAPAARPLPLPEPTLDSLPTYVVARREIPRGSIIESEALSLVRMERAPSPEAATQIGGVVGRIAVERIAAGQTVLASGISDLPAAAGLGALVPVGQRAVTLRLAEDTGVAFLVQPGDRVDVLIATHDDPGPRAAGPANLARLVLQDVQVLAIGDSLEGAPHASAQRGQSPQRTATLALSPEQLPLLGLVRADGGYLLALRNPADHETPNIPRLERKALLGEATAPAPLPRPTSPPARSPARAGPEMILGPMRGAR